MASSPGPAPAPSPTWILRLLSWLADFDCRYARLIIVAAVISCLASMVYTAKYLTFDPDQANLIKRSAGLQAEQDRYTEAFPKAEDIVVVVEDGTAAQRQAFIDDLARRLRAEPQTFQAVFEKVDLTFLRNYALHYLSKEQLADLSVQLGEQRELVAKLAASKGLPQLLTESSSFVDTSSGHFQVEQIAPLLPMVRRFIELFTLSMESRGRAQYVSPWIEELTDHFGGAEGAEALSGMLSGERIIQYNTISNGRFYALLCRPTYKEGEGSDVSSQKAVARLRQIIASLEKTHTAVIVGVTGEIVLSVDEAEASTQDSMRSALLSLVLIAFIFIWAFREWSRPLMAVCTLVVGVGWTMGFTTLVIGHLNLLTVTFATILMGLGIDFGIHFIYRYDEERLRSNDVRQVMRTTLCGAGYENLTGAVSTALAFYVLAFTDFTGIAELGIIAGSGILLCYSAMSLVLPALIYLREDPQRPYVAKGISQFAVLARLERRLLAHSGVVVVVCVLLTALASWYGTRVHYDYNLLNLQAKGLQSVRTELHLINSSEHSLLCGIALASSVQEACQWAEEFNKLSSVSSVETVAMLVPSGYQEKLPYLRHIVQEVAQIPVPRVPERNIDQSRLPEFKALAHSFEGNAQETSELLERLKLSQDLKVRQEAKAIERDLNKLFKEMAQMGPGPIEHGLDAFERQFYQSLRELVLFLKDQVDAPPLTIEDIPQNLRQREIGRNGLIQVRVFPKENIWERSAQERFVREVQGVCPQIVGMPIMAYYDCQELRTSNEEAGVWALAAIGVLLLIHFRKLGIAILALLPKVVGIVWMVGLMGYLGVNFNSANFLALPLILGIGLVFGMHIIHRVAEDNSVGIFGHSTGPSITLAALTTIMGFATMIDAQHQGVATLGLVMTLGVSTNLLTSTIMLPAVINVLRRYCGYKLRLH